MDIEYVGRLLLRLQPFVSEERVIRRSRVQRVLGALRTPPENLTAEIDRLLAKAGISIDEDSAPALAESDTAEAVAADTRFDVEPHEHDVQSAPGYVQTAVAAARRRIEADRRITNHAKVLLRTEEVVGLGILVRGETEKPLKQGDFAKLTGEPRDAAVCLLLHNQGLVRSIAKPYAPSGMTADDLFQHGITGLIRSVELFDPHKGNRFSTYATNWIRQAITRGIANESRMIRLPVHMYERVLKVWKTRAHLTVDGEAPSLHQLATACGLTDEQVTECLMLGQHDILSLDSPVAHEGEATLGDLHETIDPYADPEHEIGLALLQERIASVLKTVSEREASVVAMRFGLLDDLPKTLDEIGKIYGVSRERIRQIEKKAMTQLVNPTHSRALRAFLYGVDDPPLIRPQGDEFAPEVTD